MTNEKALFFSASVLGVQCAAGSRLGCRVLAIFQCDTMGSAGGAASILPETFGCGMRCGSFYFYRFTENFRYRAFSNLDLEIHYSVIEDKAKTARHFQLVQRLELEANPFYTLRNGVKLNCVTVFSSSKMNTFGKSQPFSAISLW